MSAAVTERPETITFRNFRGIDVHRTSLFPESFVPEDNVLGDGLLLNARNLRFSNGRAYWHRNQLRIPGPAKVSGSNDSSVIDTVAHSGAVRSANVVTITTTTVHGLVVGNQVTISGVTDASFNGTFLVASVPTTSTFTYAQTGPDAVSGDGLAAPCWPTALLEFVGGDYNQLLVLADDGHLYHQDVDWTATPTQWVYGYELFAGGSWTDVSAGLPYAGRFGFANVHENLFLCSGQSLGFGSGMETRIWDGAALTTVGLTTPTGIPAGTVDTSSGGLIAGTYSYRVTFGNSRFESMPSGILDKVIEEVCATGNITSDAADSVIADGDTVVVGADTYTFTDDTYKTAPYQTHIVSTGTATQNCHYTLLGLARMIRHGAVYADVNGNAIETPANTDVDAIAMGSDGGVWKIWLQARTAGDGGNALDLSTTSAVLNVSGAHLSGGVTEAHIDLSSIPTGPAGTTWRKLYRAWTAETESGSRGADFQYLDVIADNSATTYADTKPQTYLGEPIEFDHAMPPRGDYLAFHRDRLWMAGVCRTSESYKSVRSIAASPSGATWADNVVTITTTAIHTLTVGDTVTIYGVTDPKYDGTYIVTSTPTTTTFTYSLPTGVDDTTSGEGTVTYGIYTDDLANILYWSQLDEPYYWPVANQVRVGSSAAIVGIESWHDQLLILKTDSVWVMTGYYDQDFRLTRIPGLTGAIGNHVATSPYGVLYASHEGWTLWDGEQAKCMIEFHEDTDFTFQQTDIRPPRAPLSGEAKFPGACYHAGRFHIWNSGYTYSWEPDTDTWEVARRPTGQVGYRTFEFSVYQSHILTFMRWGDLSAGLLYITILDDSYKPDNAPYGRYTDSKGSGDDDHYGEVLVELPPLVAPPGQKLVPLEVWIYGQWTKPAVGADDLKLFIFNEATSTWGSVGTLTANSRLGIPAGYAKARLRLMLYGAEVPLFALHSIGVTVQRRAARG